MPTNSAHSVLDIADLVGTAGEFEAMICCVKCFNTENSLDIVFIMQEFRNACCLTIRNVCCLTIIKNMNGHY